MKDREEQEHGIEQRQTTSLKYEIMEFEDKRRNKKNWNAL